ncbi:hypothetical protein [Actinoalloteichus caeruleus]|uniref:hypothetical protein n=1 Tax=Actinoalloteichus cyanogriseus TaxID=2893586 RepID=UPI00068A27AA|nr:hypothetical protein [Actinoalloteichus caeruleus]
MGGGVGVLDCPPPPGGGVGVGVVLVLGPGAGWGAGPFGVGVAGVVAWPPVDGLGVGAVAPASEVTGVGVGVLGGPLLVTTGAGAGVLVVVGTGPLVTGVLVMGVLVMGVLVVGTAVGTGRAVGAGGGALCWFEFVGCVAVFPPWLVGVPEPDCVVGGGAAWDATGVSARCPEVSELVVVGRSWCGVPPPCCPCCGAGDCPPPVSPVVGGCWTLVDGWSELVDDPVRPFGLGPVCSASWKRPPGSGPCAPRSEDGLDVGSGRPVCCWASVSWARPVEVCWSGVTRVGPSEEESRCPPPCWGWEWESGARWPSPRWSSTTGVVRPCSGRLSEC